MQESARAAVSYLRSRADLLGIDPDFSDTHDLHIHVPEGAIPKDGPSAGITMATALVSALTRRPVRRDLAMTGEITLRGKVLPVGGIKDKVLAAFRAGITEIILPRENEKDLEEIPAEVRGELLNVHFVESMDEVLRLALEGALASPPPNAGELAATASEPPMGSGRWPTEPDSPRRNGFASPERFESPPATVSGRQPRSERSAVPARGRGQRSDRPEPDVKIDTAEFVRASADAAQVCPDDGSPEVAFVGRSNVGKSSLLNRLLGPASWRARARRRDGPRRSTGSGSTGGTGSSICPVTDSPARRDDGARDVGGGDRRVPARRARAGGWWCS